MAITDKAFASRSVEMMPTKRRMDRFQVTNEYFELKTRIHDRLIDLIDLSLIDSIGEAQLRDEIRKLTEKILSEEKKNHSVKLQ